MRNQHCFCYHQAITWVNAVSDLCRNMASLGNYELVIILLRWWIWVKWSMLIGAKRNNDKTFTIFWCTVHINEDPDGYVTHRDPQQMAYHGRWNFIHIFFCMKTFGSWHEIQSLMVQLIKYEGSWWCHQMETFPALLAVCAGNSPVTGEFPAQRPVSRSFAVFFDLCLNKRLCKQSWGWWFETQTHPLWRHCNVLAGNDMGHKTKRGR